MNPPKASGRDCPICRQPNMTPLGKSSRPLIIRTGDGSTTTRDVEFYHCENCDHVEFKSVEDDPDKYYNPSPAKIKGTDILKLGLAG